MNKIKRVLYIIVCIILCIMFCVAVKLYIQKNKEEQERNKPKPVVVEQNNSSSGTITIIGKDPNTEEVVVLGQYKGTIKHNDAGKAEQNIIMYTGE